MGMDNDPDPKTDHHFDFDFDKECWRSLGLARFALLLPSPDFALPVNFSFETLVFPQTKSLKCDIL